MTIASRVSLIVADLIVLGVTWHATYRMTRLARVVGEQSMHTFSGTLLLDGTSYIPIDADRGTEVGGSRSGTIYFV